MSPTFQWWCLSFHNHHLPSSGSVLRQFPRCFGVPAFSISLLYGHLCCMTSRDSGHCSNSSKDACWRSAHQYRRVNRMRWVAPSTIMVLREFSSHTDPKISVFICRSWAKCTRVIGYCLNARNSLYSFGILSSMTWLLRRNWTTAELNFNVPSW